MRGYRLSKVCPSCGATPNVRPLPDVKTLLAPHSPSRVLFEVKCQALLNYGRRDERRCGREYEVTMGDFTVSEG